MSDTSRATVRQEGDRVLLVIDGKGWNLPHGQAKELARLILRKAALAEEFANADQIIADHALLTRVGFPVGLSDNPKIKDAVRTEAAWNSDLRRYLPGGVKAQAVFGTPGVTGKPPPQRIAPGGVPSAGRMGVIGGR